MSLNKWVIDNAEYGATALEANWTCAALAVRSVLADYDRLCAQVDRLERLACYLHHMAESEGLIILNDSIDRYLAADAGTSWPECLAEVRRLAALEV